MQAKQGCHILAKFLWKSRVKQRNGNPLENSFPGLNLFPNEGILLEFLEVMKSEQQKNSSHFTALFSRFVLNRRERKCIFV
jgi:hypothetical protein